MHMARNHGQGDAWRRPMLGHVWGVVAGLLLGGVGHDCS